MGWPQRVPKWPHDGQRRNPKWAQDGPSGAGRPEDGQYLTFLFAFCSFAENHVFYEVFCASQGPKRAPRRLREGPGWRQEGPRWRPEGPRLLQNCPKTAQDSPQENREWRQEGLRCPQNGPKRTQQGPNDAKRQQDTLRVPLDVIAGCFWCNFGASGSLANDVSGTLQ